VRVPPKDVPSEIAVGTGWKSQAGGMKRERVGERHRKRCEENRREPRLSAGQRDSWLPSTRSHRARLYHRVAGGPPSRTRAPRSVLTRRSMQRIHAARFVGVLERQPRRSSPELLVHFVPLIRRIEIAVNDDV